MKAFRRTKCTDRDLAIFQDAVAAVLVPVSKNALIDGVQLDNIAVTTAGLQFPHTLRRQPLGWFLVDTTAAATVHRSAWDSSNITLIASAPTTVSIWIY